MAFDRPAPIAIYIAAENQGDTEALAQCFAEDAESGGGVMLPDPYSIYFW